MGCSQAGLHEGSGFSELDLVGSGSSIEITFHQANEKAAELHF